MQTTADVVIIGGGIVGASVAYHLAEARTPNLEVVLLEQHTLAAGTTGKSVAVLEFQHATRTAILLRQRSLAIYQRFFQEPASGVRFQQIGGIGLAQTPDAAAALQRGLRLQQRLGVPVEWLEPQQLSARVPAMRVEDLAAATYCSAEGYVDPYSLVVALIRQAQRHGVTVYTGTVVTGIVVEHGHVRGVVTNRGPLAARWVVNAAGPWAKRVAQMAGIDIPLAHTKCQILAVRPQRPSPSTIPWVLGRRSRFYLRGDAGGVVLLGRLVHDFHADHLWDPDAYVGFGQQPDEDFSTFIAGSVRERMPTLAEGEVVRGWVGLRAVTPDARPLLGETPVAGFLLAAGFGGFGIQLGAVAGEMLAEQVLGQQAPAEVRRWSVSRFA